MNTHTGSMRLLTHAFLHAGVKRWRGSTFARSAALAVGAGLDHFWEMMGWGPGRVLIRGRRLAEGFDRNQGLIFTPIYSLYEKKTDLVRSIAAGMKNV